MKIYEMMQAFSKPELYAKGNSFMWTDPYISKQLLKVHLDKEIDLASRKESSIETTIDWLLSKSYEKKMKILDLGCGPGLYSQRLAELGHQVTGIDVSSESINYAALKAKESQTDISYIKGDYLELDFGQSEFDLVIMIYTDFGVLSPMERSLLLKRVRAALKPNGRFIFDVLNDLTFSEKKPERTWDFEESGFWSENPYLHLYNSRIYTDKKVVLYQHLVVDKQEPYRTYHFWTHFFSHDDLEAILEEQNLRVISLNDDVLAETDQWNGKNVTFAVSGII